MWEMGRKGWDGGITQGHEKTLGSVGIIILLVLIFVSVHLSKHHIIHFE